MDQLTEWRLKKESERRRFWCDDCGWLVWEGSVCEELDDEPEGRPEAGRTGPIHIDPRRQSVQRDFLIGWFAGKPSPTDIEFTYVARMATERADQLNLKSLAILLGETDGVQPSRSPVPQLPVADLPAPVVQVLCDKIRAVIEETMQRATKEVFDKQEAAEFLGISVSLVEKEIVLGKLKRAGNSRRVIFTRQALVDYLTLTPPPPRPPKRKRSA